MATKTTSSDVLEAVSAATGSDVTAQELASAMYAKTSPSFKSVIGDPSETNSLDFINGVLEYPDTLATEWVSLATRIGRTIAHKNILKNKLSSFKMDNMRLGYTLEEFFVDAAKEHGYDQSLAEEEQFKRELPDIKTAFYTVNRKAFYKQTITDDDLRSYFVTWDGVSQLIAEIVNALYNGDNRDEYNYMKSALVSHYENGYMKIVSASKVADEATAKDLARAITEYCAYLTEPSNGYNAMGVTKQNDYDDLYIVLNAQSYAYLNIDWLAQTFQLPVAEFKAHVLLVPTLPKTAQGEIQAMIVDKEFFRVFDQKYSVTTKYNGEGLYWNYWLHHWEGIATSRFANAIAFVSGVTDEKVTAIYVSPTVAKASKGESVEADVSVQTTGIDAAVSLTATASSDNITATLSDDNKKLTVTVSDTITTDSTETVTIADASGVSTEFTIVCKA